MNDPDALPLRSGRLFLSMIRILLLLLVGALLPATGSAQKFFEAASGAHLSTQLFAQYPSSERGGTNNFARQLRNAEYRPVAGADSRIGLVLTARNNPGTRIGLMARFGNFAYHVVGQLDRGGNPNPEAQINSIYRFGYGGVDFYVELDRDRWGFSVGTGIGGRTFRQVTHRREPPLGLQSPENGNTFFTSFTYGNSNFELRRYFQFRRDSDRPHPDRYFLALRAEVIASRSFLDLSRGLWGMLALNVGVRL